MSEITLQEYNDLVFSRGIQHYENRLINLLPIKRFPNGVKVLDIGCGCGQWSIALMPLFKNITSMDINKELLKIFQENIAEQYKELTHRFNTISIREGNIEKLPIWSNDFDFVVCTSVLQYVDKEKAIKEISRVLKPGGFLFLNIVSSGYHLKRFLKGEFKYGRLKNMFIDNGIRIKRKLKKHGIHIYKYNIPEPYLKLEYPDVGKRCLGMPIEIDMIGLKDGK
jgi:ubiquinone/menaquinone biosynthesis C-methylase UbiE